MALEKNLLVTSLTKMFTIKPISSSMPKHFKDFAQLYDDYAKDAIESGGGNGLASTGKTMFESTMSSYSLLTIPILSGYASYIELACIAYWNSSAFSTIKIPLSLASITSITISPMASMSLQTNLLKAINTAKGNPVSLANGMAEEIDNATKTVKVTIVGPNKAVPPVQTTLSNMPIS